MQTQDDLVTFSLGVPLPEYYCTVSLRIVLPPTWTVLNPLTMHFCHRVILSSDQICKALIGRSYFDPISNVQMFRDLLCMLGFSRVCPENFPAKGLKILLIKRCPLVRGSIIHSTCCCRICVPSRGVSSLERVSFKRGATVNTKELHISIICFLPF